MDEYSGLKCLWLENNCITNISGLDNQTELVSLYIHNNAISKIENLDFLNKLNTINLSHNFIRRIENLGLYYKNIYSSLFNNKFERILDTLQALNSLIISHNKLSTANDISHLANCKTLSIVDLSYNYLDDSEIVDVSNI